MRPRVELVNFGATQTRYVLSYNCMIRCVAFVVLLLLGAGCGGKKKPSSPTPSPSPGASPIPVGVSASGATWTIKKNGQLLLSLTADSATAVPDASGKVGARLTGQKATLYRANSPFMELTGEVRTDDTGATVTVKNAAAVFLKDNMRVSSDTITWNRATGRIHGDGNVRAKMGSAEIQGTRFTADDQLTEIDIDLQ